MTSTIWIRTEIGEITATFQEGGWFHGERQVVAGELRFPGPVRSIGPDDWSAAVDEIKAQMASRLGGGGEVTIAPEVTAYAPGADQAVLPWCWTLDAPSGHNWFALRLYGGFPDFVGPDLPTGPWDSIGSAYGAVERWERAVGAAASEVLNASNASIVGPFCTAEDAESALGSLCSHVATADEQRQPPAPKRHSAKEDSLHEVLSHPGSHLGLDARLEFLQDD